MQSNLEGLFNLFLEPIDDCSRFLNRYEDAGFIRIVSLQYSKISFEEDFLFELQRLSSVDGQHNQVEFKEHQQPIDQQNFKQMPPPSIEGQQTQQMFSTPIPENSSEELGMVLEWESNSQFKDPQCSVAHVQTKVPNKTNSKQPQKVKKYGRKHFFPHFMILIRSYLRQTQVNGRQLINKFGLTNSNTFSKKKFLTLMKDEEFAQFCDESIASDAILKHLNSCTKYPPHQTTKELIRKHYPSIKRVVQQRNNPKCKFVWLLGD